MSENSIEFSLSNSEQRDSWLNSGHWTLDTDNLLLIPNILLNSRISSTTNCSPLSDMILSGRLCNFHTLSLNSLAKPFANVFSIVGMKWTVTNFIWSYLHQIFDDSHGLRASLKPLRRPFDRCQSHLETINNGRDIK